MGMGEPLANYGPTLRAVRWLIDPHGLDMRARGVTISTVGLEAPIRRLAAEGLQVGLTVSLHAPDDSLRRRLIPTAGSVTIEGLLDASREYVERTGRRVTFAYALLEGVNDKPAQARRLAERVRGMRAHVNLIPYNPTAGEGLRRPLDGPRARVPARATGGRVSTRPFGSSAAWRSPRRADNCARTWSRAGQRSG